jgi:uncharacterized protein (DUF362 family)
MDRRQFLRGCLTGAGALVAGGLAGCPGKDQARAGAPPPVAGTPSATATSAPSSAGKNRVLDAPPGDAYAAIATGKPPAELVQAALAAYGGLEAIIRKGDTVAIKPNLAWARGPETGANTNPEVLKAVIQAVQAAGAGQVIVVENPCVSAKAAFAMSGAQDVCDGAGVKLVAAEGEGQFSEAAVPRGKLIKSEMIASNILDCDVYINLPCLKHHGATNMTLCLKNQMGAIPDPQRYHRSASEGAGGTNLDQSIADLASALVPTLNIVDATRALTTNGPQGPGVIKPTNAVIVTHDMVAADALGAQLLGCGADQVAHIAMAAELGVGKGSLDGLKVARV